MNKLAYLIVVTGMLFLYSCTGYSDKQRTSCALDNFHQKIETASFDNEAELIKLDNRFIEIAGIFRFEFENVALYSRNSLEPMHALWIETTADLPDSLLKELDGKYVTIVGRLDASGKGHMAEYLGTLDSAFCFKVQ